jgi:CBS domain-containing protein
VSQDDITATYSGSLTHPRANRQEATMRARDVMSHPVITVRPHVPARAAAALLVSHGFTAAPVVDAEGRVRGIITESDLLRGRIGPDGRVLDTDPEPTAAELMGPPPPPVAPDADLADVAAVMLGEGARSVPILEHGRLVGIVTRRDVLRMVAREAPSAGYRPTAGR